MKRKKFKILIITIIIILLVIISIWEFYIKESLVNKTEETEMNVIMKTESGNVILELKNCDVTEHFYEELPLYSMGGSDSSLIVFQLEDSFDIMDLDTVEVGTFINAGEVIYDLEVNSIMIIKSDYSVDKENEIYIIGETIQGKDFISDITDSVYIKKYH